MARTNTEILTDKLTNIAGAIREKNGDPPTTKYSLDTMADKIRALVMDTGWVDGAVTFGSGISTSSTAKVRRCGNIVTAELDIVFNNTFPKDNKLFTFKNEWKAKSGNTFAGVREHPVGTTDVYEVVNIYMTNGSGDVYVGTEIGLFNTLRANLWFEAESLT